MRVGQRAMRDSTPERRSNAARFLDAFAGVESHLRKLLNAGRDVSFSTLVARASETSKLVRRYETDLKEYADLRNAIVHERRHGQPIADPYAETVAELEQIRHLLERPPLLLSLFPPREVVTCTPDQPVGRAARSMLDGNFSQLPVYSEHRFQGLLTTNTIARWLGSTVDSEVGLVEEATVEVVLPFAEGSEQYLFVDRGTTVFDALEAFDRVEKMGQYLNALLITDTGTPNQSLLNIVTVSDLPRLLGGVP